MSQEVGGGGAGVGRHHLCFRDTDQTADHRTRGTLVGPLLLRVGRAQLEEQEGRLGIWGGFSHVCGRRPLGTRGKT